jgi:hypothetical protein
MNEIETEEDMVIAEKDDDNKYCDHGIYINHHCKSCECIEQADMRSEME